MLQAVEAEVTPDGRVTPGSAGILPAVNVCLVAL
jgi:hypothetical protein